VKTRVLCLGNDFLADDGVGIVAAEVLRKRFPETDVVDSNEAGFALIDYLMGVDRVIVIDSIQTGTAKPGTIYHVREEDLPKYQGSSPHYIGLFESMELGKKLELPVARDLQIIAIEAADCRSLGGPMHPSVTAAIPQVVELVESLVV
jgi:hydrogenase maturation protease